MQKGKVFQRFPLCSFTPDRPIAVDNRPALDMKLLITFALAFPRPLTIASDDWMRVNASDKLDYHGHATDQWGTGYGVFWSLAPALPDTGTIGKLVVVSDIPTSWSGHYYDSTGFVWWAQPTLFIVPIQDVADPGFGTSFGISYTSKIY